MLETLLPYTESGDTFDSFVVHPSGTGPHPLVLLCHAYSGRDDFIEGRAREIAKLGYIAAAIDVYGIGERGEDHPSSTQRMTVLLNDPKRLRRRLRAAHDAALMMTDVDKTRVSSIGYCFGDLCALLMARMGLPLKGAISFHGLLKVGEPLVDEIRARILVLHGQDDPFVPATDISAFAEEMRRLHADWQLHVYPRTLHAFTNPAANEPELACVYHEEASRRSWATMTNFLSDIFREHE